MIHNSVIHKGCGSRVIVCAREEKDHDRKDLLPIDVLAEKVYYLERKLCLGEILLTEIYISSVLGSFSNGIIPLLKTHIESCIFIHRKKREKYNGKISLLYPYAIHGTLKEYKSTDHGFLLTFYQKLEDALQRLHRIGYGHFDIKPSNVLVTEFNGEVIPLLADFGLSQRSTVVRRAYSDNVITPIYRPHYMVNTRTYNENADYWSLGLTLLSHTFSPYRLEKERDHEDMDFGKIDKCLLEWKKGIKDKKEICQELSSAVFDSEDHSVSLDIITDSLLKIVDKAIGYLIRGQHYDDVVIEQPTLENPSHSEKQLLFLLNDIIPQKHLLRGLKFLRQWYPSEEQVDTIYFMSYYMGHEFKNLERKRRAKSYAYSLIAALTLTLGEKYMDELRNFVKMFIYSETTYKAYLKNFCSLVSK